MFKRIIRYSKSINSRYVWIESLVEYLRAALKWHLRFPLSYRPLLLKAISYIQTDQTNRVPVFKSFGHIRASFFMAYECPYSNTIWNSIENTRRNHSYEVKSWAIFRKIMNCPSSKIHNSSRIVITMVRPNFLSTIISSNQIITYEIALHNTVSK